MKPSGAQVRRRRSGAFSPRSLLVRRPARQLACCAHLLNMRLSRKLTRAHASVMRLEDWIYEAPTNASIRPSCAAIFILCVSVSVSQLPVCVEFKLELRGWRKLVCVCVCVCLCPSSPLQADTRSQAKQTCCVSFQRARPIELANQVEPTKPRKESRRQIKDKPKSEKKRYTEPVQTDRMYHISLAHSLARFSMPPCR